MLDTWHTGCMREHKFMKMVELLDKPQYPRLGPVEQAMEFWWLIILLAFECALLGKPSPLQ
eukprot:5921408-Amphidinium_carterae.1